MDDLVDQIEKENVKNEQKTKEIATKNDEINKITKTNPDIYTGGMKDLKVAWIPEGTLFRVDDYDGSESVELKENDNWLVA